MPAFARGMPAAVRALVRPVADRLCRLSGSYQERLEAARSYQRILLTPPERAGGKRILIAVPHFWPSVGGLEHRVEQLSRELVRKGYQVFLITPVFPGRVGDQRHGVRIINVDPSVRIDGLPAWPYLVRKSVLSGFFDACLLIQDPLGELLWSVEQLVPPPGTRVIIQPIINTEGFNKWRADAKFSARLAGLLRGASVSVAMTRSGPDIQFMIGEMISPAYIPNACAIPEATGNFRATHDIPEDSFLILHVANLWWIKNHLGLLEALSELPNSWKLVLVGSPTGEAECARAVLSHLARRPEVLFIPGLSREDVSSAMEEADVIVLSSFGEGSPNTILEAMAHGRPWLATPECGAANDNAGGIICSLPEFQLHLAVLQRHPELRRRLGEVGRRHWQACFSWDRVIKGWIDLIEEGRPGQSFTMPFPLAEEMDRLRALIVEALVPVPAGGRPERARAEAHPPCAGMNLQQPVPVVGDLVNIGMVTYNRLEFTKQTVAALTTLEAGTPFVLTVVDNASTDGTREYLQGLQSRGVIRNLVLLDENVGVAKASNLAWSLEPQAEYYLKLDNDIVVGKLHWLGAMVHVYRALPEVGAVAYNFEPTSYPLITLHGIRVRPKLKENLGGACILISRRTHERLGYWCEDYGLYGEEDADYGTRIRCAGLLNLYMEDEEVGFHLPSGRAAELMVSFAAFDGVEEVIHAEYRNWKDDCRRSNMLSGKVERNVSRYLRGGRLLYVGSPFLEARQGSGEGPQAAAVGQEHPGEATESYARDAGRSGLPTLRRLLAEDDIRVFYAVRNLVYAERFVRCKGFGHGPGMLLLAALVLSLLCTGRFRRIYVVLHAVFMGWRGELGLHPKYLLPG